MTPLLGEFFAASSFNDAPNAAVENVVYMFYKDQLIWTLKGTKDFGKYLWLSQDALGQLYLTVSSAVRGSVTDL